MAALNSSLTEVEPSGVSKRAAMAALNGSINSIDHNLDHQESQPQQDPRPSQPGMYSVHTGAFAERLDTMRFSLVGVQPSNI